MDPVHPKRRTRRLFGSRRRSEPASEEEMEEHAAEVAEIADGSAPEDLDPPTGGTVEPASTDDRTRRSTGQSSEPGTEPRPAGAPVTSATSAPDPDRSPAEPRPASSEKAPPDSDPAPAPLEGVVTPTVEGGHVDVTSPPDPSATVAGASPGDDAEPGPEDANETDAVVPYDLPRILAIANQKGGVGKTTTSVNLGASLAEMGYRVLVVDLDPQGNASTGLGVNARELEGSVYDVIMSDAAVEDCVEPTSLKNLFVVPATIDLAGAEIELVPAFSRELKLRRALHEVRGDYDFIVIDCPPSLGLLTVNGLAAADDVVVPIQCEYYALEGLSQLIRNVTLVQKNLNPSLEVRGIVLTMYDARTKLADQVEQEVRKHFGRTVYQTVIPRTVRLSEAPSFGQPIILFDPTSRGAVAYRELAKEVSSGATRRTG